MELETNLKATIHKLKTIIKRLSSSPFLGATFVKEIFSTLQKDSSIRHIYYMYFLYKTMILPLFIEDNFSYSTKETR